MSVTSQPVKGRWPNREILYALDWLRGMRIRQQCNVKKARQTGRLSQRDGRDATAPTGAWTYDRNMAAEDTHLGFPWALEGKRDHSQSAEAREAV